MNELSDHLDAIKVKPRFGEEKFHKNGEQLPFSILGYWQWSGSDLLNNAARGILAEYIVACDLGVTDQARVEWDACDLVTKSGIKVEVKSAAYLQSWKQSKSSAITFSIAPTYGWDAKTNESGKIKARQAEVYVFCLLSHKDKATVDPIDVAQWRFFLLTTKVLNEKVGQQKSISLNSLLKLKPIETAFGNIGNSIEKLL
ncbi:MAG: hypothetical protein Q7K29_08590 [Thermoleophilia bacterium]|nr:hypothetical protein [Thermoleophilia bacterium]